MIKRIIFDLDGTLIMWEKEYDKATNNAMETINYPYTQELCDKIYEVQLKYEKDIKHYNKQELLKYINARLNVNLPIKFIDEWMKNIEMCVPKEIDNSILGTLEYLYKKYELVILTNWFEECQMLRLKNAGIDKYFKKVYAGEKYAKPHKEAFIHAIGGLKPEECAMVGDSLKIDIRAAQEAGIKKVIWKDNNNEKREYSKELEGIDVINHLSELKNIL